MNRVTLLRAIAGLALAVACDSIGLTVPLVAVAQGVYAPAGQPTWFNRPQVYPYGAAGTVNPYQPTMVYGGTAPVTIVPYPAEGTEIDCSTQPPDLPFAAPVQSSPTAWGVPTQAAPSAPPVIVAPLVQPSVAPAPVAPPPVVPGPVAPPPVATAVLPPVVVQPAQPYVCSLFGEILWLHPTGADVAFAQQQDGGVPIGLVGVADPSYDIGFRVGGEWRLAVDGAIFGSYAFFDESTASTLVAPAVGEIGSLVHHPDAGITTSAGPVNATYDIEFQLGELAYRHFLALDPAQKVSVFAGGRFGHLEQNFSQIGDFAGVVPGTILTTTNIEFNGGGPMAGIDAERRLGVTGFSAYGRALIAALSGQFKSNYRTFNTTTTTLLTQVIWEDDRIVPMLDYELGLAWTSPAAHFRFAAGYLASHWFNAVTTPVFVDAVQADNFVDVDDTISFDGLVGRAEFRW